MSNHAIVYVHGISSHSPGYSNDWFASLQPHLNIEVEKHEVLWSNIVNPAGFAMTGEPSLESVAEQNIAVEIQAELAAREMQEHPAGEENVGSRDEKLSMQMFGGNGLSFDDFIRYMVSQSTREQILQVFDDVVVPLLNNGYAISVISHSWGTVVSYEALARLGGAQFPGYVANLFTLGSALSIGAVQRNLFQRVSGTIIPGLLREIVNVDAGGDIVGGSVSPPFTITREHLRQYPTGCATFKLSPGTARSPKCAHSSYFNSANEAVQKGIIADQINATAMA